MRDLIVAKVGGSLYDWPGLGDVLRSWLASVGGCDVMLIPGGGATADVIRDFHRTHPLDEHASHWLAIHALSLNARFLQWLVPESRVTADRAAGVTILDAWPFFDADERRPDPLPHSWQVTSDSLAVRAAVLLGARELILLKSIDWSGADWREASQAGVVDGYFPEAMAQAPATLEVRVVNLRTRQ
ncbi:MAG TPA: hypothetical protein VFE62_08935 [Gemmataceae bacterium]|nr:hypothetical protein [Gemmataceae bacterium]